MVHMNTVSHYDDQDGFTGDKPVLAGLVKCSRHPNQTLGMETPPKKGLLPWYLMLQHSVCVAPLKKG